LLDAAGITYVNNHEGHDMPGMPTDEELNALSTSKSDFDQVFTGLLRAHLDESTVVVRSLLSEAAGVSSTTHAGTKAVAQQMVRERAADLPRLDQPSGSP
jgi:hypothetical protein